MVYSSRHERCAVRGYRFLLLVGKFDFGRIEVGIELAQNSQACGDRGAGDEVDDGLVCFQWSPAPVMSDSREEPVFDLVPFASTW